MMSWRDYSSLGQIHQRPVAQLIQKLSVTGDILSYQLCPRQYNFFGVKGYQPNHLTQAWFGTIVHQVLDKLHLHYAGRLNPQLQGQFPTDADVDTYFNDLEKSLKIKGVKNIAPPVRQTALNVLKTFNRIEGPSLYPNIVDTECNLESHVGNYILHGKVDVLKDVSAGQKPFSGYDPVEIWDYKGSKFPDVTKPSGYNKLERYKAQMLAYAKLYQNKTGNMPLKCILYFMNELDQPTPPLIRPSSALFVMDLRDPMQIRSIDMAMSGFSQTANDIAQSKATNTWAPPQFPDEETCNICDRRWNCPGVRNTYPPRYP